jgi:hypothetical protein
VEQGGEGGVVRLARTVWALVQGDARFMRRLNGWLTLFWVTMIPVSFALGWLRSVTYVSALSLWALVSGHWSTWQAARVEVSQQDEIEKEEQHPTEERVVDKIVERTDVEETDT